MKLDTRKFAIGFWVAGALLMVGQQASMHGVFNGPFALEIVTLLNGLASAAFLFGLGAIIHLLGEVRDRLPERS